MKSYEQKYKAALEWMQGLYSGLHGATKEEAEHYFPELKESKDERIRKTLIEYIKGIESWNYFLGISKEQMIAWLEKQGENKSVDKPKFKVGDWITDGHLICKVLSVTGKSYELHLYNDDYCHFETDIQSVDKYYRLWAIEDAKDGDVLVAKDGHPFIFTGEFDVQDDNPTAYCGINSSDKFITGMGSHWTFKDGIKPATKEQQDLLFAKMKEAGYEWDSEKNELKKVEQGNHPRIVMADFTGGEGFYKLNLDNLNEEQVFAIEIMINNPKPGKKIDADKVIAWLVANICDFEYYVKLFKKDFGL